MRTMIGALPVAAALALVAPAAFAVSDGNYTPRRQHCSGGANNSDNPTYAEDGCLNYAFSISDYGGHEYFGWGSPQTADHEAGVIPDVIPFGTGSSEHQIAFWTDPGPDQGGCTFYKIDFKTQTQSQEPCPWFVPTNPNYYGPDPAPNPSSGFRLYNGADDNLAGGEHDSSEQMNNGSSDGGAIQLNINLDPNALQAWAAEAQAGGFFAHPLPIADAGGGACADGLCISVQTTQRSQAYPTDQASQPIPARDHGVADYGGFSFDPDSCEGGNDSAADCQDAQHPGYTLVDWNSQNGDPTVDPGIQIFEDPDAQASPLGGPYPIPAIYVGTCGIVIGGGPIQFPAGPMTNDHGQIVIDTGCHGS